jgi:hypothetical protein
MWLFRRRREETLNEILLREAGLDGTASPANAATSPEPDEPRLVDRFAAALVPEALSGVAKPAPLTQLDDAVTAVHAPGIGGDTVRFVALPNGDLIVEEEEGDDDLGDLASAVEQQVAPRTAPSRVGKRATSGP